MANKIGVLLLYDRRITQNVFLVCVLVHQAGIRDVRAVDWKSLAAWPV